MPWHAAEYQIAARNADTEVATLLGILPHSACPVVDRRTWRAGEPVSSARLWFPGTLQTFLARSASGAGRR